MLKTITATTIQIQLKSDKYIEKPYPKSLHGLCYHLAGENYPHNDHLPPMFHPFINNWKASKQWGTKATIRISNVDEKLTRNMLQTLAKVKKIRLGSMDLTIDDVTLVKQETIPLDVNATSPVPDEFKLKFDTPTKFRSRSNCTYATKAYPDIQLFIRSVARNLHLLFGVKMNLEEQDNLIANIDLMNAIGYPIHSKIERNVSSDNSFIGELHLNCQRLTLEQKKMFGLLLKTAKYTGVGHKKGYGFGHIQIKRPY